MMGNLHEQTRDEGRMARLERLIEINRSLNSTLSLRPLLNRIVVAAQELTQTEATSILLLDRGSGQLYFEAATNLPGVHSIVVPMEDSVAGWVVQTGKPLVVPDARKDPRFYRQADEQSSFTTRSILATPLIARDKVIGVLEAVNKEGGDEFTDEDVELLVVLSGQAAVAVQNALLFQQSDLVAEIVHEMRTPLMSIGGYAELMQKPGATTSQCSQFAEIIRGEVERLNGLASDFLDLARLESGRASLAREPVDLSTVIQMTVSVLMPQAEAKKVGVSVDVPTDLPPVVGDAQRLHQAMLNLLGNAIKYCHSGDNVTVTARSEEDNLVVVVSDTGPGIPAEALPHVFERFYRVTEGQVSGTGLGLTITQRIVEAHGGEITVSSEEGRGATFIFTLPVEDA
ncbi:MAG: GAF domain-containing sensor histidine kinase [Chloroflexi bacterium]|nr:GAF domain-containing sensor histidine kinase [Chloroflexota bacterium]